MHLTGGGACRQDGVPWPSPGHPALLCLHWYELPSQKSRLRLPALSKPIIHLLQVSNLPVFWKQQRLLFFDAFSYSLPAFLLRIPFSAAASLVWTVLTYFPVGLAGEPSRR